VRAKARHPENENLAMYCRWATEDLARSEGEKKGLAKEERAEVLRLVESIQTDLRIMLTRVDDMKQRLCSSGGSARTGEQIVE
jgi:hypothetical protein